MYRANATNAVNEDMKKYIGLANSTFKERHSNGKRDFKHQKYRNCTELAKYVWELKEKNIAPIIKWEIVNKVCGNSKQKMCVLYLTEKLWIISFIHDNNYLHKNSELINKCRHINKHLLKNVKSEFESSPTLYECIVFSKIYFGDILSYIGISELTFSACQLIGLYLSYRGLS